MVGEGYELHPPSAGFRAFAQGPRDCIEQTSNLIELRYVLIMGVRIMRSRLAYEEWDETSQKNSVDLGWHGWEPGRCPRMLSMVIRRIGLRREARMPLRDTRV
jgi:hypothetical protein